MQGRAATYGGCVERFSPSHGDVARIRHQGDGLFAGIPSPFSAVRYQSLAATGIPAELLVTAVTPGDDGESVVLGVRHRSLPRFGVDFHPESILSEHGAQLIANFLLEWT
jgi:anthranilate synthase component II